MRKVHDIKILPDFAEDILNGDKTFEIRENDRGYQTGGWNPLRGGRQKTERLAGRSPDKQKAVRDHLRDERLGLEERIRGLRI